MLADEFQLFSMGYEDNNQWYSFQKIYWFRVESELTSLHEMVDARLKTKEGL
jgi:hypothetical protein